MSVILIIIGLCVGIALLWEMLVNMFGFISSVALLFIYFPIVTILDLSFKSAWGKTKDKL